MYYDKYTPFLTVMLYIILPNNNTNNKCHTQVYVVVRWRTVHTVNVTLHVGKTFMYRKL